MRVLFEVKQLLIYLFLLRYYVLTILVITIIMLFIPQLARHHAPSTIFIDEVDAILSARGGAEGAGGEHEASR